MLLMLLLQVTLLMPLLQIPLLAALSSSEELRRLATESLKVQRLLPSRPRASAWAVDRASWESALIVQQPFLRMLVVLLMVLLLIQSPLLAAVPSSEGLRQPPRCEQLRLQPLAAAWTDDRASSESGRIEKEVLLMLPSLLQVPVLVLLIQVPPLRALLLRRLASEQIRPRPLASVWADDHASSGWAWIEKQLWLSRRLLLPMPPALLLVLLVLLELLPQLPLQVLLLQAPPLAALPSSAVLRRPAVETLKGQQPSLQPLAFASADDHASWGSEWIEKQGRLLQPE